MRHPARLLRRLPRCLPVLAIVTALAMASGCAQPEPPRRYPLHGQVLRVDAARQTLTIRHEDIPGLMPAMTMSFPVASRELLEGREPGELVTGTLEVTAALGVLVELVRTGFEPLPEGAPIGLAADLLEPGDVVPDTAFIDQNDRRRALAEWRGRHTLLTFIYTRCPLPNFCPLLDQNFATLQRSLAESPVLAGRVALVTVSIDPEHDTPAVLAAHAARRKADPAVWTFLTGDRVTVERFAARFGVSVLRPDDTWEVTHNLRTVLLDPDLRVSRYYTGNEWTPGAVVADLRALLGRP